MRLVKHDIPPLPDPLTPASVARWLNQRAGWLKWSDDEAARLLEALPLVYDAAAHPCDTGHGIMRSSAQPARPE